MRRTKIVCTIGPASSSVANLDRLAAAGMDVARQERSFTGQYLARSLKAS